MLIDQTARNPGSHCRHRTLEVAKCLSRREANLPAATVDQPVDHLEHRPPSQPFTSTFFQGRHGGVQSLAGGPTGGGHLLDPNNEPVVGHGSGHLRPSVSEGVMPKASR